MRAFSRDSLEWRRQGDGVTLCLGRKVMLHLVRDERWPTTMWRICRRDGSLTDMLSLTRAKEAGYAAALAKLNGKETRLEAPYSAFPDGAATTLANPH